MEIKGRLTKKLPPLTGQGKNGEWKKQDFVIELEDSFNRKLCVTCWGDKVDVEALVEGAMLNVHFDIESREYQGKWYTNLTAWKVEAAEDSQQPMPPLDIYQADDLPPSMKDDLPF